MPGGDYPLAVSRLLLSRAELEGFPRDGIHYMSEDTLLAVLEGLLHLWGLPLEGKVSPQHLSFFPALELA